MNASSTDVTPAWKRRGERSNPGMLAFIIWVALSLGRPAARALLVPIVAYFLLTARGARRAARAFLPRVLNRPARIADLYHNLFAFASCALDRVFLLAGRHEKIIIRRIGDTAVMDRVHAGRAILLTSHLGSFDVLRVFGTNRHDMRFRIVMDRAHGAMITGALERLNPDLAGEIIDSGSGPALGLALREALDRGCVVGMMADRLMGQDPGVSVPFFGQPARLPTQPWRWAAALGVPVLLCFGLYRGGNRYELHFEAIDMLEAPVPRAEREAYVADCVARYAGRLEHYARLAPYNWFNFYDFWADDAG